MTIDGLHHTIRHGLIRAGERAQWLRIDSDDDALLQFDRETVAYVPAKSFDKLAAPPPWQPHRHKTDVLGAWCYDTANEGSYYCIFRGPGRQRSERGRPLYIGSHEGDCAELFTCISDSDLRSPGAGDPPVMEGGVWSAQWHGRFEDGRRIWLRHDGYELHVLLRLLDSTLNLYRCFPTDRLTALRPNQFIVQHEYRSPPHMQAWMHSAQARARANETQAAVMRDMEERRRYAAMRAVASA